MNNKGLLIVILVILAGIFAVAVMNAGKESSGEQISDDASELTEGTNDHTAYTR